jgi:hypothetical protein
MALRAENARAAKRRTDPEPHRPPQEWPEAGQARLTPMTEPRARRPTRERYEQLRDERVEAVRGEMTTAAWSGRALRERR